MLTFAVVVRKRGRVIPPWVTGVLGDARPPELTLTPDSHVAWTAVDGGVAFGGWQQAAERMGVGSHWHVDDSGLHAFSGHLWPREGAFTADRTWASQLADHCAKVPLAESSLAFHGMYGAVSLGPDGRGCVTSDPLGMHVLYRAESADVAVVSNRAHLAARLVTPPGRAPARDPEGVGWLVYAGRHVVGDRTGFSGVTTVPQGSRLDLDPVGGMSVRTWSASPWRPGSPFDDGAFEEAIESVRAELVENLVTISNLEAAARVVELTGGQDSRLILALLMAGGMAERFVYATWGPAHIPDCVIASEIADTYGLVHLAAGRPSPPRPEPSGPVAAGGGGGGGSGGGGAERFEDHVRHDVRVTDGLLTTWEGAGSQRKLSANVSLSGLCGEGLSTNYAAVAGLRTKDDLISRVRAGKLFGLGGAGLLKPEAREHYTTQVLESLTAPLPDGSWSPQDAVDDYFLAVRLRRMTGTTHELNTMQRVFPLYSLPAMHLAFGIGWRRRWAKVVPFELMRRSAPDLAAMPFDKADWPEEAFAHLPDAARYRRPSSAASGAGAGRGGGGGGGGGASAPAPATTVVRDLQHRAADERVPVFRSLLDLGPHHPLYDIVDRDAVVRALDGYADAGHNARLSLHGAVTAAVWLDGGERAAPGTQGGDADGQ